MDLPNSFSGCIKQLLTRTTNLAASERPSAGAAGECVTLRRFCLMKNAGGHERWRGARGPFFFQSATLESDVLEFLRSDAGWCQVKDALMAEQDKKQCMSADEQALKRELIYSLMPDDTATGKTLNGQRVLGSCPLKRLVAFNKALKEEMKPQLMQLGQNLQQKLAKLSIDDLGISGRHFCSTPPMDWFNFFATIQAMHVGKRSDKEHFDGGASIVHMGLSLWGERRVSVEATEMSSCARAEGAVWNCDQSLPRRLQLDQQAGDFYMGNFAAVWHQVHHDDQESSSQQLYEMDGERYKLAIMFRTCCFAGIARATKVAPTPKIVWEIICHELQAVFASACKLPTLANVLREHDKLL